MRKRFEQQGKLGVVSISEVKLPLKSRDELPPILRAMNVVSFPGGTVRPYPEKKSKIMGKIM
ncbi:MAG: hypothetical protein OZ917_12545 [Candidatus Brocadiaceae bacterium]|nr:hypothetical protein [Candidatus Brocadiaceae bacterium]